MDLKKMHFTFSDTIAGYVTFLDWDKSTFNLKTSDGREFKVQLTDNTYAELMRNLNEPYKDCTVQLKDILEIDKYLYAYGIFYQEGETYKFDAKHIVFLGSSVNDFLFEKQDWWIKQVRALADFYINAQFGQDEIDFSKYRSDLNLEGEHTGSYRQETDTISRLVYGLASAYMMTGEERYLTAAEKGTKYLRDHMRSIDTSNEVVFWYHAIDKKGKREKKILASEFGDDYDAIPAYEQIYALAGPTQTYRITGDPEILKDVDLTVNLFDKYFLDKKLGGYFSHIDPITFDPRAESLGDDRARKNWNSVGDHAPAYLINIWLATGEKRFEKMLKEVSDTIADHFPDYENSPFVQEKFHENWDHDITWKWQQNKAVVGHNLKIAWNLMRVISLIPEKKYSELAKKIAELMPEAGGDSQRGGWYDVVNRKLADGEEFYRFAWHDRKAWWQQEQGILAYLILAGILKDPKYLKIARESASFYNAWFLDHDSGAVYFNVLANGLPYLLGTERFKGSHSMSGYHSFELAYLAAVYTNLLVTKQHMDFYFKPIPGALKNNILRVQPDILPKGSIKIDKVWINDQEYNNYNADDLTVILPKTKERVKVKVRIIPTEGVEHFDTKVDVMDRTVKVTMSGDLDPRAVHSFRKTLTEIIDKNPQIIEFILNDLQSISSEGARAMIFAKQKMDIDAELIITGANKKVKDIFEKDEFLEEIIIKN